MMDDCCNCQVSLDDPKALAAWNGVVHGVLAHGQDTGVHLNALLDHAPQFAMGHAMKGLACLMMGRRELRAPAQEALQSARAAMQVSDTTVRERLWVAALDAWLRGYPTEAIARMEAALKQSPTDTISLKLSQGIRFMLGDHHGMRASVEAVMPAYDADHPLYGYVLGCLSFALEETGHYEDAERAGLEGLSFAQDDAWGLHAVAHVYDMTHRVGDGLALLDANTGAWAHCNNFRFHVWWHKALLHLDDGDVAQVLELYDSKIRSEKTDDYRDFSNASSLLVRLELEGVDVGSRWDELADLAEARTEDGSLTFADMHYILALTGDTREDATARMVARVAKDAKGTDDMARVMYDPGRATAEGLASFGNAQYAAAFAKLSFAQPRFQLMGGSHAQRDVFERLTIEAGLRAGQLDKTEDLLRARTRLRNGTVDRFASTRLAQIAAARDRLALVAAE